MCVGLEVTESTQQVNELKVHGVEGCVLDFEHAREFRGAASVKAGDLALIEGVLGEFL